ncbi:hypothetical protein OJ998_29650 [Solirubrobacter taibaiensis]|nr:hypothetical protein [Solirubrobacter taibaiensis]
MSHRRILLGALLGATAFAALPAAANAATCSFDSSTGAMDIRYRVGESSVRLINEVAYKYSDGGSLLLCIDAGTGIKARIDTTREISIRAAAGTAGLKQTTVLEDWTGDFADINPNLDISVLTGTDDRLVIVDGPFSANMRLMEQTGSLAFGPLIDLNADHKPDLRMTTLNSVVEVRGGGRGDKIDATLAQSYNVELYGESGEDFLLGGQRSGDLLDGGSAGDTLYSHLDDKSDTIRGGTGTDTGIFDVGIDYLNGVETPTYG